MNFPSVPNCPIMDKGQTSIEWINFFSQMWTFFQVNFSNEGLLMPSLDGVTQIPLLTNAQNGTMVYNTTTNKAMVKENGSFVNIV